MPGVQDSIYKQRLVVRDKIYSEFRTFKNCMTKLIFCPSDSLSEEAKKRYLEDKLSYFCVERLFDLQTLPLERGILNTFYKLTKYQVYDFIHNWYNELGDNMHLYYHCHCAVFEFDLEIQANRKMFEKDSPIDTKVCYKVCEECYDEGSFYGKLRSIGYEGHINVLHRKLEHYTLHMYSKSLCGIIDQFITGNAYYDDSEKYNTFTERDYFCSYCNRALLNNITYYTDPADSCTSCYNELGYDDIFVYDEEGLNADEIRVWREKHDVVRYSKYYVDTLTNAKRKLSFPDIDWIDCRRRYNPKSLRDPNAALNMEDIFRSLVIDRGVTPLPPREPLPLRVPDGNFVPPKFGL